MNTFELTLDLDKRVTNEPVRLRQGDKDGTAIQAKIYDHGTLLSGSYTARFVMLLPDREHYYRKSATYADGVATLTIDETQAASVVGTTDVAYFQIMSGSTVIASTQGFTVRILPSATANATVAESYDDAIQSAIDALETATAGIPAEVVDEVDAWLAAHPEATTTVQDNSVTDAKLVRTGGVLDSVARIVESLFTRTTGPQYVHTSTDATPVLAGLTVHGESVQDGTPTPDAPVAIESVGPNLYNFANESDRTNNGVTWTVTDEGIHAVGTASGISYFKGNASGITDPTMVHLTEAGTYTIVNPDGGIFAAWAFGADGTSTNVANWIVANAHSFTITGERWLYLSMRVNSGTTVDTTYRLGVFKGTMHMGYAPYGSIGLRVCGKNKFAGPTVGYSMNTTTGKWTPTNNNNFVSAPFACKSSSLTFVVEDTGGYVGSFTFARYAADGAFLGYTGTQYFSNITVPYRATIALGNGTAFVRTYGYSSSGTRALYNAKIAIYDGTVSDGYVPYTETLVPIDLGGRSLRSLPDGTRDEVTVGADGHAVLVQRVGVITLDGSSEVWGASTNNAFYSPYNVGTLAVNQMMCSHFPVVAASVGVASMPSSSIKGNNYIYVKVDGITSLDALKAWLASNPVTVLYPLAAPVTIDLGYITPASLPSPDLTAAIVPTAPSTLTVGRDPVAGFTRLAANLAPAETSPATANHAVGALLTLDGQLVRVTRAIAVGEVVAIGTNVASTDVASELAALA